MPNQLDGRVWTLREKQHLYLRQVASLLEMDTAQLSKIKKGTQLHPPQPRYCPDMLHKKVHRSAGQRHIADDKRLQKEWL